MQVSNTNTSYKMQETNSTNLSNTTSSQFDISLYTDKNPKDITFDEYQKLTDEDIEKLYGKNTEKSREAYKLQGTAKFTDDETLNKVLFEKTLNDTDNDFRKFTMFAILSANAQDMQMEINRTFDPDNLENVLTPKQLEDPFYQEMLSRKDGYIPPKPTYEDHIDVKDGDQLINYFRNFKEHFDEIYDKPNVTLYFDKEKLFQTIDDIVKSYDNKVNENNEILEAYTKNNKQILTFE